MAGNKELDNLLRFASAPFEARERIVLTETALRLVVAAWGQGLISSPTVHAWAEALFDVAEVSSRAVIVVLSALDGMDMNLLIAKDAQFLLRALDAGDDEDAAEQHVENRLRAFDIEARKRALKDDPFYAPFTRD
jgi:hypothetical protein